MKKTIIFILLAAMIFASNSVFSSCVNNTVTPSDTANTATPTETATTQVNDTLLTDATSSPSFDTALTPTEAPVTTSQLPTQIPTSFPTTTTPTESATPTPTEEPEPVLINTSGSIRTDTGTYLNLVCNWKIEKIEETKNYIFTAVVVLESYSLYCSSRNNGKLVIGDMVDMTYFTPDLSIDREAGFQSTYFTAQNCVLNRDQVKSGIDLYASWSFYGVYSGIDIDVLEASGHIDFC